MKKGILFGLLFAFVFCIQTAYADIDPTRLMGDYVAVGAINMQTLPERKLFTDLMAFFVTDSDVSQILKQLSNAGLNKRSIKRIVVGIPDKVENAEFLAVWEILDPIEKYSSVLKHFVEQNNITPRHYNENEYYCLSSGVCVSAVSEMLVLANESRLKSFIDVTRDCKTNVVPKEFSQMYKVVDRTKDAWLVFALNESERIRVGQADPIVDMTKEHKGQMKLGSIRSGSLSLDFSTGLSANILVENTAQADAKAFVDILAELLRMGLADEGVRLYGLVPFLEGIKVSGREGGFQISVNSTQEVFDHLTLLVSDMIKTIAHTGSIE